jgi:hypothetical protein
MDWHILRHKLQVKEDRGHFGLAWSVLAAYGIAVVLLLLGWHPRTRGMIDFRFVAIIVYMVVGAVGVAGAFAAALRIWPHDPRSRDIPRYENAKKLYLDGLGQSRNWGELAVKYLHLYDAGTMTEAEFDKRDIEMMERIKAVIEWRDHADILVREWFGDSACRTFMTEPQVSPTPPEWQRGDQWFTNWSEVAGRLAWLRRWLLEQDDL